MIHRHHLLTDLRRLLRELETDLRQRCDELPEVAGALQREYDAAKEAERTAESFEDWRAGYVTQAAVAWVLSCVFVRFLEDNDLVAPPRISGPKERLRRARDEYDLYVHEHPTHTYRDYLLSVFDKLAELPGGREIFGEHNPIHQQRGWLSGDAAGKLLTFFQKIDPATGELIHDFRSGQVSAIGDANGVDDTRFLGDLYQDLSEEARDKYALLQTPEFVEEFILDRTLDPAIEEFGLDGSSFLVLGSSPGDPQRSAKNQEPRTKNSFRMIDPACGSGHFLLGSFARLFGRWSQREPGTNSRVLAQRALDSVHGVDVNPYAAAIARFRLLLAALKSCGITRLADAPAFHINVVCGDSLLHGAPGGDQLVLGFHPLAHAYQSEDLPELRDILKAGHYHAVVANPPYITPKDRALNAAYRERYSACHGKYSLSVPFMQRIFGLAISPPLPPGEGRGEGAGYTGQITANSFMKREFGKKLIERFLPTVDLSHVIDTSGAYIPGHGTPTVILFGRSRFPVGHTVRAVLGINGEPSTPSDPARGCVWSAILEQMDKPGSQSRYVSVSDTEREKFHHHPWSIGGGGAAELKEIVDDKAEGSLADFAPAIGITAVTGQDELYMLPEAMLLRYRVEHVRKLVEGDAVRDWQVRSPDSSIWLYDDSFRLMSLDVLPRAKRLMWGYRAAISRRHRFGTPMLERGLTWYEWQELYVQKLCTPLTIVFAEVATHNHFVLDRGGKVFKQTAPVIKLPAEATEEDHLGLLGLLNSSTACFWLKQVCHNKGSTVDQNNARQRTAAFEDFYAFNSTAVGKFPVPEKRPSRPARALDDAACRLACLAPENPASLRSIISQREPPESHKARWRTGQSTLIAVQEELDWQVYRLYGLLDDDLTYAKTPPGIELGQRAFEIVLARKMAAGELQTTWFERHGSTPVTDIPNHWPEDYRRLVQRRMERIASDRNIALIEQPEYKRRWNTEPWDEQLERALKNWLLDRLESYFDFDGRTQCPLAPRESSATSAERKATKGSPIPEGSLVSTARVADLAARDADFMQVAELYRGRNDFDVARLVEELIEDESVPLLPILRYKPGAMEKRQAWERTWEAQRQEDRLSDRLSAISDRLSAISGGLAKATDDEKRRLEAGLEKLTAERCSLTAERCSLTASVPVPPEYKTGDFQKTGYWRLRGKLDVPKERWVSFSHCAGEDGCTVIAWAGYNHLQLARAIGTYYAEVKEKGGGQDARLMPLLASILELVPWLKQWHNEMDPEYQMKMGDYFAGFVEGEAKELGLTVQQIREWKPPERGGRRRK